MGVRMKKTKTGIKYDIGKLDYSLVPPDAMDEFVAVLTYGKKKYAARNWEKGMDWGRNIAAAERHISAWKARQDLDPESAINHLAHAICDLNFVLAYQLRGVGKDDRGPKVSLKRR
jgi:hypothetical protein